MKNIKSKETAIRQNVENIVDDKSIHTLVIREDAAIIVHEKSLVDISGILDTPARWLEKRMPLHLPLEANVIVDREEMTIALTTEERDHFATHIKGSLEYHPIFIKFGINDGSYITPAQMADKIKMNRSFFENKTVAMSLVSQLKNFKAKVDMDIEKSNDNRGNRTELLQQTVTSNMPESFKMSLPIFKGEAKKTFEVEVYIEATTLECTLISPEANEEMEYLRDNAIEAVLARIKTVDDNIVILEK